jgi:hypothetical protein
MTSISKNLIISGFLVLSSGCARMPDASIEYFLPKTMAIVTVNQTVSCVDLLNPTVITDVDIEPYYSADTNKSYSVNFSDLDTFYSSGSATITKTDDGRLESFNSNTAGSGSDVVNTFVSLIEAVSGFKSKRSDVQTACEIINSVAGEKDKKPLPLSIVLKSSVDFINENNSREIITTPFVIKNYPQSFYVSIEPALGSLSYQIGGIRNAVIPVINNENWPSITLVEPAIAPINVIKISPISNERTQFKAFVPVPQWGAEYSVPVPKPPMFGSNEVNLALYGSGKIKSLKYGTTNGAKDLGTSISTIANQFEVTDSEKAQALKDEADVIAQQQRLIKCQTKPAECK